MTKAAQANHRQAAGSSNRNSSEGQGLLSDSASDEEDIIVHPGASEDDVPKTPRSANRVRFDVLPPVDYRQPRSPPTYDDSQSQHSHHSVPLSGHRNSSSRRDSFDQDASLLNHSAGSPAEWEDDRSTADVLAHLSRPKSSLRSAMSNMANSIIGAGIIGQPYALRQAGFVTGVTLLILLTITVDWTIRLIVINSKMSGRDSFQGTMEHCFGRGGLIAISVAQWAFAFGGMVAFGVIVGDSIPHVLVAVWPGLEDVPVVGILANRRAVIFIFIMAVSWPLSLYRDIAKVRTVLITSSWWL